MAKKYVYAWLVLLEDCKPTPCFQFCDSREWAIMRAQRGFYFDGTCNCYAVPHVWETEIPNEALALPDQPTVTLDPLAVKEVQS